MAFRIYLATLALLGPMAVASFAWSAEHPDFSNASQVRDSIRSMIAEMKAGPETSGWQTLRAVGMCEDALDRLEDRRTSAIYTPAAGEAIWRSCRGAYSRTRSHQNPTVEEPEAEDGSN
jgi:hypothetical protein